LATAAGGGAEDREGEGGRRIERVREWRRIEKVREGGG
jgi:hypothetical protein